MIDHFATINATTARGNFNVVGTRPVATSRLDDVADCPSPDYAKLDVQGSELNVLMHGVETISKAMVLEVEVEFVAIYKDQPLFGDIHTFLHGQGWMLHKLVDVAGRSVRPFVHPNPFASVSQALWAYDKVRGTTLSETYMQAIAAADNLPRMYMTLKESTKILRRNGWGAWIRTRNKRVRAARDTVSPRPNRPAGRFYHIVTRLCSAAIFRLR